MTSNDLSTVVDGVIIFVVGGLLAWAVRRIIKAGQAETAIKIDDAVDRMRDDVVAHVDQQVAGVNTRLDGLGRELTRVDAEGRANAEEIAYLRGALNMPPTRATLQVTPPAAAGPSTEDH